MAKNKSSKLDEQRDASPESKSTEKQNDNRPFFKLGPCFIKKMEFDGSEAIKKINSTKTVQDPVVKIELSLENTVLSDNRFEVDLTAKITATVNEESFYKGLVSEAGIFLIKNCSEQQMDFILKAYCPSLLFPYIRESVSTMVVRSGFKPIDLPIIDFIAVYQQSKNKEKNEKNKV